MPRFSVVNLEHAQQVYAVSERIKIKIFSFRVEESSPSGRGSSK